MILRSPFLTSPIPSLNLPSAIDTAQQEMIVIKKAPQFITRAVLRAQSSNDLRVSTRVMN